MGDIKLSGLERVKPQATIEDFSPNVPSNEQYLYKDLKLDLSLGTVRGDLPANKAKNTTDVEDHRDLDAIIQSVKNIFNTTPGQKLLNPFLGVNLSGYLFEPITTQTGDLIARLILKGLADQEPRVNVAKLFVEGDEDQHQYNIEIMLEFPNLPIGHLSLTGVLNRDGMQLMN